MMNPAKSDLPHPEDPSAWTLANLGITPREQCGKHCYTEEAVDALVVSMGGGRKYHCALCDAWHYTTKRDSSEYGMPKTTSGWKPGKKSKRKMKRRKRKRKMRGLRGAGDFSND